MKPTAAHGTIKTYTLGFAASLALTLLAYSAVTQQVFAGWGLVAFLVTTAVVQLFVQLRFFLHLGRPHDPMWNLVAFVAMAAIVATLVTGSLWIMSNLRYHGAQPTDSSIMHEEGISK